MPVHRIHFAALRPFFAEVPYYLWGRVNYDSDGDCQSPTDRGWTSLDLMNRDTRERVRITGEGDAWTVEGDDPLAARAALFLVSSCEGRWAEGPPTAALHGWDHDQAASRAARVRAEFERPELQPFAVGHLFWGSWKWIGWFATQFTWVGRWIMHAVVRGDRRAVTLCVDWLRAGTFSEQQSQALRYSLERLTGRTFATDEAWVEWYDHGGGSADFPEPDFDRWLADLKAETDAV